MSPDFVVGEIYLWWIGEGRADERMMEEVRVHVERVFEHPVRMWNGPERPTSSFDPARRQHSSTRILRWLLTSRPPPATKILAVTDADLFIPVLTFVFGEAQLDGAGAVVSAARLRSNPGGLAAGRRLLTARLVKECIHELGHTFGLIHCTDARCAMARSATVLDVDAKRDTLCESCRVRFRETRHHGGEEGHD